MSNSNRREELKKMLLTTSEPIKGQELAEKYNVTRQVIVKDIAIIRAEGYKVISTPKGYMILSNNNNIVRRVIAVNHTRSQMQDELNTIIKYGGVVEDVVVEHALYGEIRGMLMLKSMYDVENFCRKFEQNNDEPLSALTNGVHLHTISCENEEVADNIVMALKQKRYLINDYK